MDIVLIISLTIALIFSLIWLTIDANIIIKRLVIYSIIMSIVSILCLQPKEQTVNYYESNILNNIKFNKVVGIKEITTKRKYGSILTIEHTYEINY